MLFGLLLALVAAGCGSDEREQSPPTLPAGLAAELAGRSDTVAAKLDTGDSCGALADAQSLQQETIAAINAGRVPPRYQEELSSAVGALAASIPCTITPPTMPDSAVPEDDEDDEEDEDDEDEQKGKGKGKGKGKKGKRG